MLSLEQLPIVKDLPSPDGKWELIELVGEPSVLAMLLILLYYSTILFYYLIWRGKGFIRVLRRVVPPNLGPVGLVPPQLGTSGTGPIASWDQWDWSHRTLDLVPWTCPGVTCLELVLNVCGFSNVKCHVTFSLFDDSYELLGGVT